MNILLLAILFAAIAAVVIGTYPWPWMDYKALDAYCRAVRMLDRKP